MISKNEYMKIFDYILENNLIDGVNITNDLLLKIRQYVKGKITDNIFITNQQKEIIINHFLKQGYSFNDDTPKIILENELCINKALNNNIYSINYLKNYHLNSNIIKLLISKKYIISINSPMYIKKNYQIILNSIKIDCFSVDYIMFDLLNNEEKETIIKKLLNTNYFLNSKSHIYLRENKDIIIHSINNNVNSYEYSFIEFYIDFDILKSLIDNKYEFKDYSNYLKLIPLSFIKSENILYYIFNKLDIFFDDKQYNQLFTKLYYNLISNYPTIKSFESLINYLCDCSWNEYRNNNLEMLSNIYSKIIAMIKKNQDYSSFKKEYLNLGNKIANVIGDKYYILEDSIEKYYSIYHSDLDYRKLEPLSLIISKLSSLYIAMEKEQYKCDIKDSFSDKLLDYYIPKLDNKIIRKKILHYIKKEYFIIKFNNGDLNYFKDELTNKYINLYGSWIKEPINLFFNNQETKLKNNPDNYNNYLRYLKALKLVNRLNQGYIKYQDQELNNYKDTIIYDNISYRYIGNIDFDINKCKDYFCKEMIFKDFIKEVMLYIDKLEIDEDTYNKYLKKLNLNSIIEQFPFTDEYYEFNSQILNHYRLGVFIDNCVSSSRYIHGLNKTNYNTIYKILFNNNLIWLWTLGSNIQIRNLLFKQNIKINNLIEIFNNIDKIKSLSNYLNIDYTNYGNLSLLNDLVSYSDNKIINLINPEIINTLCSKSDYTAGHGKKEIIKFASDLICQMASKDRSTVPYINNIYNGYHYLMYDCLEDDVLETGDKVDSCLKVCGNDNDFLNYCMLDKNGFIIKITNQNNHLIARAAGFRNGNFIYINQLRTIYDTGGCGYNFKFKSEKEEIVEVLIKACNDLVNISQNSDEEIKIDYVFITQSYAFEKFPVNKKISDMIKKIIGEDPVDITTDDWYNFIKNSKNLLDTTYDFGFRTDYNDYNLICIASSKNIDNINNDIHTGDIEAIYKRPRNKIIVTSNITNEIIRKINKIRAIYTYYHNNKYSNINISDNSLVIIGDNWYLVYKNTITDYCVQDFDESAQYEFNEISNLLLNCKDEFKLKNKIKVLKNS